MEAAHELDEHRVVGWIDEELPSDHQQFDHAVAKLLRAAREGYGSERAAPTGTAVQKLQKDAAEKNRAQPEQVKRSSPTLSAPAYSPLEESSQGRGDVEVICRDSDSNLPDILIVDLLLVSVLLHIFDNLVVVFCITAYVCFAGVSV